MVPVTNLLIKNVVLIYLLILSLSLLMMRVEAFGGGLSSWIQQQQPKGLSDESIAQLASIRYQNGKQMSLQHPMEDKVVVITGAAGGIGKRLSQVIHGLGGTIVAMDRDMDGLHQLQTEFNNDRIRVLQTHHEDLNSVANSAKIIQKEFDQIDLLINNAGMSYPIPSKPGLSKHGKDLAFTVNYLSHFLLTEELLPLLQNGRIVQVTSSFHWKVDGSELVPKRTSSENADEQYLPMAYQGDAKYQSPFHVSRSYANTKLAQIWHTRSLYEKLQCESSSSGGGCSVVCACPTWVGTGIAGEESRDFLEQMAFSVNGAGVTSILNAIFRTDDELQQAMQYTPNSKQNEEPPFYFVANSKTIEYIPFIYKYPFFSSALSKMGWRDTVVDFLSFVLLIGQRFTYDPFILQKTSPESYNKKSVRDAFYQWSKNEIYKYMSNNQNDSTQIKS